MSKREINRSKLSVILVMTLILNLLLPMLSYMRTVSAQTSVNNLVLNPGFENGTTAPQNWTFLNASTSGSYLWDTTNKNDGNRSLKLTTTTSTDRAIIQQRAIPVKSNTTYKLTFYAKTDMEAYLAGFGKVIWANEMDAMFPVAQQPKEIRLSADAKTGWTKYEQVITSIEGTARAWIQLQIQNGVGNVWFDSISLEEVETISPQNATYTKNSEEQLDIQVSYSSTTPSGITYNGQLLNNGTNYEIMGSSVILKKEFLELLPVGNNIILFNMSSGTNLEFSIDIQIIEPPITEVNLVKNPGFEDGTDAPENWTFINANTSGSYLWDTADKYDGNRSLKLTTAVSTDRAVIQQRLVPGIIPVKSNTTYKFTFYAKTDMPIFAAGFAKVIWADSKDAMFPVAQQPAVVKLTADAKNGWTKYEQIVTSLEGTANVWIQLQIQYGVGNVWFDSIQLEELKADISISPQSGTLNQKVDPQDIAIRVNPIDGLTGLVYNGKTLINGTDYEIIGQFAILKKGFLATLPVGKNTISFNISDGTKLEFTAEVINVSIETNQVQNPSFEEGIDSPEIWTSGGSALVWDESEARDGNKSIKLTDNAIAEQKFIPIYDRYAYQFSAFYKTENMEGTPSLRIEWYTSEQSETPISLTRVNGLKKPTDWAKLYTEELAPEGAKFVSVYLEVYGGTGTAWFDQMTIRTSNVLNNANFEDGSDTPYYWDLKAYQTGTAQWLITEKCVELAAQQEGQGGTLIGTTPLPVISEKAYFLRFLYKTTGTAIPSLNLVWYDKNNIALKTDNVKGTSSGEWKKLSILEWAPKGAVRASIQVDIAQGIGSVFLDDAEFRQTLVSNVSEYYYDDYKLIPVTDVEDFDEKMTADEFWDKIPAKEIGEKPEGTVWTQDTIRNFFFGPYLDLNSTEHPLFVSESVDARDNTVPHLTSEKLGQIVDPALTTPTLHLAIADDIVGRPFLKAHPGASNKYYPRRTADHLVREYYPSYILTGDEKYKNRAKELLEFLEFSQYKADGSNEFIQTYYPNEGMHPEWAGGWDFLFDWEWIDGTGLKWKLHEPDHHVSSSFAMSLYHAYEFIEKDPKYLEQARAFVYNIVPHYGLHMGVYKNHTYYWSEYNATGKSEGNPTNDAIDNAQALIGTAVAMAGYYETDPTQKAKFLELARGIMWYLVREYETDGRFYYYGSETKTLTMPISHDRTTLIPMHISLAYLYKAGVDVSDILEGISTANEEYYKNWGFLQSRSKMNVFKLYDGEPKANETLKFTSFVQVTNANLKDLRFIDTISADDFVIPERLDLRISKILSPTAAQNNWTVDEQNDFVLSVTPEQLQRGIDLPFEVNLYDVFKISYEVTAKDTFDRQVAKDFDSELIAWEKDEQGIARYIHVSSGLTPFGNNKANTMPLRLSLKVNSENFLSYTSRLLFPIEENLPVLLEPTIVPTTSIYEPNANWGVFEAEQYVYPVQSVAPFKSKVGTGSLAEEMYSDKGKTYYAPNVGDSVTFEFEVFLPEQEFQVLSSYSAFNGGGKQILRIDGEQQGGVYNTLGGYSNWYRPVTTGNDQGTKILSKGKHTVTIEAAEAGKTLSIYDAITLRPVYPDATTVAMAKMAAENATYSNMTQETATNETVIEAALKAAAQAAINNSNVTVVVNKVSYTASVAGSLEEPDGIDGSYTFTVTVSNSAGSQSGTTAQKTIIIKATAYAGSGPSITYYTITANAGKGGQISPQSSTVQENTSKTFTITPDEGYEIENVRVDGKSVGNVTSYTFGNVTGNHTITVKFKKIKNRRTKN